MVIKLHVYSMSLQRPFSLVYNGQIDSSINSQMHAFAIAKKALSGERVYFGVIDRDDLGKIIAVYRDKF